MEITQLDTDRALALAREGDLRRAAARAQGAEGAGGAEAGKPFEAMLGTMLARELRSGLEEGFFGSGPGSDTFASWLDDFVGRAMAERGALGTKDLVAGFARDAAAAFQETQGTTEDAR